MSPVPRRLQYENEHCWMDPGQSIYFLAVPSVIAILINIFFLCSVIRVIRCGDNLCNIIASFLVAVDIFFN